MTVVLEIPFPPSVNGIWRKNQRTVYRSPKYMAWRREAGQEVFVQRPGKIDGCYNITIELTRPDNRIRDAENYIKAVSDLLVAHGIVRDDSLAISTTCKWVNSSIPCRVTLEATDALPPGPHGLGGD